MPHPATTPRRRPLSEPEDARARRAVARWQDTQPRDKRSPTFNSAS